MSGLSTKHMVLGLVVERPSYGYALSQQITERFGFLHLARTAVYKTLQRLEEDGLVEEAGHKRVRPSERAAPRVLYRATPEGTAEFKRWMAAPSDRAVLRDEFQAKLGLATPADLPELLETAEAQLEACAADLAALRKPSLAQARVSATPWPVAAQMLVDDFKVQWLEGMVDWLTSTIEVISARIAQDADPER
jgi:DNA-binding PadR family transcriptional regulator